MHLTLVMFKTDGSRRDFPVERPRVVLGRKNNCDLRIPLPSVSRQHCEILLEDDQARLNDLGSSNGTQVNGERVQGVTLRPGDLITVVLNGEPANVRPRPVDLQALSESSMRSAADASANGASNANEASDVTQAGRDSLAALDRLAEEL
jgi:pSer/pThr/pTyr-binding forkhead associated (FHA) protein